MFELYVCYNQVSYLVASEHVEAGDGRRAYILYAPDRVRPQRRYRRARVRRLSAATVLLALLVSFAVRPAAIYLPHHRVGRLLRWLAARARRRGLVDDGLDTLRDAPRNIDAQRLADVSRLLTFRDYASLGRWTEAVAVERVADLDVLLRDERPPFPADRYDVLVVESPGVTPARPGGLPLPEPSRVLYVRHGNPVKSAAVPADYGSIDLRDFSVERTAAGFRGAVVVGESMVMALCVHLARRLAGSLVVQLSDAQYGNLRPLHAAMQRSGATLRIEAAAR